MATQEEQLAAIEANEKKTLLQMIKELPQSFIFSRVFVERPRFAIVIAIVMTLVGAFSLMTLPITQYPEITPPEISVETTYPGASAVDLAKIVGIPIEQEVNGVEDMLYFSSSSTDSGRYSLSVTFAMGTDRDMNMVRVQNRISQATAKLPSEVIQQGVTVRAKSSDTLGFFALRSPNGTHSKLDLSDYVYSNLRDTLLRVPGVGSVSVYGPKSSMRIWLDPERLAAQKMGPDEVIAAIQSQNLQASLGAVGSAPVKDALVQQMYTITAKGRLSDAVEFDDIIVRTAEQGGLVKISDVARVEIGQNSYGSDGFFNGTSAISMAVNQTPGSNAIETMDLLLKELKRLEANFPADMMLEYPYDATEYVRTSIAEIVETLIITFLLVVGICYLFLQDFRSTLVPSITIPVSLLSAFMVLKLTGFTINTLTLFALLLAIGVVVDDAIVVVERVLYHMEKNALDAKTATLVAMREVTGAVIATTLVLLAIFVPVALIPGITGRIYAQFAVTISMTVVFSSVNALTLSPALCATILRVPQPHKHGPFAWFNSGLAWLTKRYVWVSKWFSRKLFVVLLIFVGMTVGSKLILDMTPTSFLPNEDQGVVFVDMSLKEGTSLPTTQAALNAFADEVRAIPGVRATLAVAGNAMMSGSAENVGMVITPLDDWSDRGPKDQTVESIIEQINVIKARYTQARVIAFTPPAIMGLGMAGGLDIRFQALNDMDPIKLEQNLNAFVGALRRAPELNPMRTYSPYTATTPKLLLDVDREKAESYKVPVSTLFSTLQNYLGSRYVNDINIGTQVNQVIVQSDWNGRATPDSVDKIYVKSQTGNMVPVSAMVTSETVVGPRNYARYNMYPSAQISAATNMGVSSGQAMAAVKRIAKETLSKDYTFEWSGLSYQEEQASGQTMILVLAGIFFGYLFLVAQYESWTIPLPVMISVMVAALGALVGIVYTGISLSIYAQLGLVLLVGLAAKNAILIVEFAAQRREQGLGIVDAAGDAAGQRLRAVLMTALTFVLGVLPLVYATGAGAAARREIGTTVYYGMLAATCVGIILIPALFVAFQSFREWGKSLRGKIAARDTSPSDTNKEQSHE